MRAKEVLIFVSVPPIPPGMKPQPESKYNYHIKRNGCPFSGKTYLPPLSVRVFTMRKQFVPWRANFVSTRAESEVIKVSFMLNPVEH